MNCRKIHISLVAVEEIKKETQDITKKLVDISHQEDLPVNVWTVNKEYDMMRMIDYGVDGIMTDYPIRLKELCDKENINWF